MAGKKTTAGQRMEMSQEDHLLATLYNLEQYLDSPASKTNGAAYTKALGQVVAFRQQLEAIRNPARSAPADPTEGLTDLQAVVLLTEAILAMPLAMQDELFRCCGAERLPKVEPALRVVE